MGLLQKIPNILMCSKPKRVKRTCKIRAVLNYGEGQAVNLPNAVSTTAYNGANQLTTWGTASLYYDANGNMTSDGTNSLVWDARNQLSSMNFSANSFQYDPFGRRQSRTVSGVTKNYLYDGVNVARELTGTTPTANLFSGGVDEVFTRTGVPKILTFT